MSQINIQNLTFGYEGSYDNIFENLSLTLDTDWRLGLTGRNGRGKTTLLQLLMGKHRYSGQISCHVSFSYFPYEVSDKQLSVIEVLSPLLDGVEEWRLLRELGLLDLSQELLYRPFDTLSGGEQTKALLAALFLRENTFLLIDEPTNHLDLAGRQLVSAYLSKKSGFILVSHDRAFLDGCVDHILAINKSNIEVCQGNFSVWWQNKERRDSFELAENQKLKKEQKRLQEAARQASVWSDKVEKSKYGERNSGLRPDRGFIGHKSAKMMKRAKSLEHRREEALAETEQLLHNLEFASPLKLHPLHYHSDLLVELSKVSLFYGERAVCRDVSFTLNTGDRVALVGRNGSGKSSILKLICGEDIRYTGAVRKGSGLRISYVSQDTSRLSGNLCDFAQERGIDESLFKTILRKLDFSRLQFEKDMSDFSAGQKKKVLLAASLCQQAHLYVWDEPLNFIDLYSRMQIEELLVEYRPTLLFVEHDEAFCTQVATKRVFL